MAGPSFLARRCCSRPRHVRVSRAGERDLEQNLQVVRESGHSRFPFTADGNPDRFEGMVLVKDLMFRLRENPDDPEWKALATPLLVIPASAQLLVAGVLLGVLAAPALYGRVGK